MGQAMTVMVDTTAGVVTGDRAGGVAAFRGIPYAQPPVGRMRFRPPAAVEPWDNARDATRFSPVAPQNPSILGAILGRPDHEQSEDCLYLNVWSPAVDGRAPVMVFIHGGAFTNGTGRTSVYDGTALARRGVVVVTINYRLGVLGFSHLADVAGADLEGSGNCGVLDQVAALTWVRHNIASFGGDPDAVTVFGESAGAFSVATLLGLPAARGLFRRAILQSGTAAHIRDREQAAATTVELLTELGIDPIAPDRLWDVPVERLLGAQQALLARRPTGLGGLFQPVVDGVTLPTHPHQAVAEGQAADVAIMAGSNLDETTLWLVFDPSLQQDEDALLRRFESLVPESMEVSRVLELYRQRLPGSGAVEVWSRMLTDAIFRLPAISLVDAQGSHQPDVYMYLFSWSTPAFGGRLGACHGVELPFVFDNLDTPEGVAFAGTATEDMQRLAAEMADSWTTFAREGKPGWDRYDRIRRPTMVFDVSPRVVDDPFAEERAAW